MRKFIRKHRKATVLGTVVGLVVAGGIAWALFQLTAPITGGVSGAKVTMEWSSADTPSATCTGNATATVQRLSAQNLNLVVSGAYPGDKCTISARVHNPADSSEPVKLTKVLLTLPTDWSVALQPTYCGQVINPGLDNTSFSPVVKFDVTMSATAAPGSEGGFGPGDGLQGVPQSQFNSAMCS